MKKPIKVIDLDLHFRILHLLEDSPDISQREIAQKLGVSLGGINYCLKALIDIGHIKVHNFNKNPRKVGYLYLLTPKGISQKVRLTSGFLKRKLSEYHSLRKEIDLLQSKLKV
ncbi:MarR_EPS, EPS-associated transcriptional regulator, MarR family [Candidatus Methylopumilus planktonicus]|uniref:MarR family EPS-associated transcriptional regulator n=1 Tax=Candidatus Methylopumilus planktonicus TaxID=1581557 RepID=UPI003BEF4B02